MRAAPLGTPTLSVSDPSVTRSQSLEPYGEESEFSTPIHIYIYIKHR